MLNVQPQFYKHTVAGMCLYCHQYNCIKRLHVSLFFSVVHVIKKDDQIIVFGDANRRFD